MMGPYYALVLEVMLFFEGIVAEIMRMVRLLQGAAPLLA